MTNFFIIAAVQGCVLAMLLLQKKEKSAANRILALWLFLLTPDLVMKTILLQGWAVKYPDLLALLHGWPFFYGPFLFLYVKYLISPDSRKTKDIFHFAPFLLVKIADMPFWFLPFAGKTLFIQNIFINPAVKEILISTILPFHGLGYVLFTFWKVREYRQKAMEFFSYKGKVYLSWLYTMLIINLVIWGYVSLTWMIGKVTGKKFGEAETYFLVSIWINVIGYFGFIQPEIFPDRKKSLRETSNISGREDKVEEKEFSGFAKYAKTKLSEPRMSEIKTALLKYMEEKPWLESTLTIKDISNETGYPVYQISQVINDVFRQNLFTFINKYRLEEAKKLLVQDYTQDVSVLRIAFDSGFNSKSSFNNLFKEYTGLTPTQFRRQWFDESSRVS